MNTKAKGDLGEQLAAEYLEREGYKILQRNAKYCDCEVDIIATYGDTESFFARLKRWLKRDKKRPTPQFFVFCEVKTRTDDSFGSGLEAVTPYKAGRYVTAAKMFMRRYGLENASVRFDIIEIEDGEIRHVKNAFDESDAKYPRH